MSYTLKYTGSEIDDILDRAAPSGALDAAIAAKQDTLTFDAVPTQGSTNPAESGGIYDAIQAGGATALAAFATDSVSGDVVSFPDGADGIPVKSFTGSIVPVQDLHGQSAPYPAGGGKNKLDASKFGNKVSESNGTYTFNLSGSNADLYIGSTGSHTYTAAEMALLFTLGAGTYVFSYKYGSGGDLIVRGVDANGERVNLNATEIESGTYRAYQFTLTGDTLITIVRVSSTNPSVFSEPQIEVGSSRTTFAPYSNVCPISGWAGANITRTNANMFLALPVASGVKRSAPIGINEGTTYTIETTVTGYRTSTNAYVEVFDRVGAFLGNYTSSGNINLGIDPSYPLTFTAPTGAAYCKFVFFKSGVTTCPFDPSNTYMHEGNPVGSIIVGVNNTILLTFGSTVYAGTITALGGGQWKIQPTHAALTLNGSESWAAYASGNGYRMTVTGMSSGEAQTGWADWLATVPNLTSLGIEFGRNDTRIYAAQANTIPSVTDLASWQAYLGTHNLNILYPLATLPDPIIVSASALETLLGANTVWADCGSVTEMTYRADTALYIQKLLNGGTLSTLSMASPTPTMTLDRPDTLTLGDFVSFPSTSEPEVVADEPAEEQTEQTEEQTEEE